MCGITGVLHHDQSPASPVLVRNMTRILAHRGPDGEGVYTDGPLGLGHRRLAIIDPSPAGHQPMATPDGRFILSYNGEVYNFMNLRLELEALGHRFRSSSDTEVVLYALAQWGVEALSRFNGMYALALWDDREKELLLARDRFGIKPLYYTRVGDSFLFASEVKSILTHPKARAAMDLEALLEYFTFQNFFTNRTLFKGIQLLPAGCFMRVPLSASQLPEPIHYWDLRFEDSPEKGDEGELLEELTRLFQQAVNRQLVSDVELGAFLSGGIDSGAISAVASTQLPFLKTFTCGFDLHSVAGLELVCDERDKAELMSYLFKTEHYEMVLKAGDMERCMQHLTWHMEEPRVGQSYPNFYAAKLASKFVKVVLAGTGGDELFGGYPWRYYRALINDDFEQYIDKYYVYWQRLISNQEIRKVFRPVWKDVKHVWTRDIFRDVFRYHADWLTRPEDYVNHSLYLEAKTFLHGLLVVEDKLSMAHGLEVRVPFLDNDLVDFAMRLPVRFKLGNFGKVVKLNENEPGPKSRKYFQKNNDGKLLLRKMTSRFVPEQVSGGIKQGFSAPDASWFRGESIEYVREKLVNNNAPIWDFLDAGETRGLIEQHLNGQENRRLLLWSLLNVNQWCEVFLKGARPPE